MLPDNIKKIHFIGIGGYGMSALAMILLRMGYAVSGSDIKTSRLTERLQKEGATIFFKHDASNTQNSDMVIYSTAIPEDNPELVECRSKGILLWHRSELLASLVNTHYGIAVAGTHGKTTCTAIISLLLEEAGLDPTAVIGGELNLYEGNARLGGSDYLVAEACESDNSFLRYYPKIALITNIEADHLENYGGDFENLKKAYGDFISHIAEEGCVVACGEDPLLVQSVDAFSGKVVLYGIVDEENINADQKYDFTAEDITYESTESVFSVFHRGNFLAEVKLGAPGRHNVSNALGAIAVAAQLDPEIAESIKVLSQFSGVGRRFEILGEKNGVMVVDDYAHHPTEIKATLQAARKVGRRRIIAIFQPHRYSRTGFFMDDYITSFSDADLVLLHSVYSAGEAPVPGVNSEIMAELLRKREKKEVIFNNDLTKLAEKIKEIIKPGDLVITMGAGDIWKAGRMIFQAIS